MQGLSRYFGGTVTVVTAGRDGKTAVKIVPSRPVPPTISLTVVTFGPVPPIKYIPLKITVPSSRDTELLPSRRDTGHMLFRPAVTPDNYRPVPP